MSTIGDKIKTLLTNQEWKQKDLAERLFVTPDAVSSWVRGVNHPTLDTIKKLCDIFCVPIQKLIDEEIDIPKYEIIDKYLPYSICCHPENIQDSEHIIIDAGLANEALLHRFTNPAGDDCSAIYRGGKEVWWHYREHEARMIYDWNKEYSNDR